MSSPRKRILIALHWYSQELHAGISRYGAEAGWEVAVVNGENRHEFPAGSYHGIVCLAPEPTHPMHAFIVDSGVPVVELSYSYSQYKDWLRLPVDAHSVGQIAAKHLMRCPVNSFLFVSIPTNETHDIRWSGFKKALATDSRPVARHLTDSLNPAATEKLAAFLKETPPPLPIGVVGSVDESARQVYDAAVLAGLNVPGDIYLMGCGNRNIYTQMAPVPITTVEIDETGMGYEAAALLDLALAGKVAPGHVQPYAPGGVIVRASTGGEACDNPLCDRAIAIMRENIAEPLNVTEIAKKLNVGKTTLNSAFVKISGAGVAAYYLRMRLEAAQGLLLAGNKIEAVAASVGFKSTWAFRSAFHKLTGCTPGEFITKGRSSAK